MREYTGLTAIKKHVEGKRIVDVRAEVSVDSDGHRFTDVSSLILEDGSRITFLTAELDGGYGIEATVYVPSVDERRQIGERDG